MTNVPAGAHVSEDGHYWWDGANWHLIDQTDAQTQQHHSGMEEAAPAHHAPEASPAQYDAGAGGTGGDAGAPAGHAVIAFTDVYAGDANTGMGPRVIIDTEDNPDNHHVLHVGAGCVAVWGEINSGNADGVDYYDGWKLDGGSEQWVEHLDLAVGQHTTRSVKLGRLTAGKHTFEVTLNGGPAWGEHREFDVSDI